jgi:hypothetical protein
MSLVYLFHLYSGRQPIKRIVDRVLWMPTRTHHETTLPVLLAIANTARDAKRPTAVLPNCNGFVTRYLSDFETTYFATQDVMDVDIHIVRTSARSAGCGESQLGETDIPRD